MDKLTAINQMLSAIGQTPVTFIIANQHPDVLSALAVLNRIDRKIQSKGYWFNTDYNLTLAYNALTKEVIIPATTLSIDPTDSTSGLVQRGTRLYDSINNTFEVGASVAVTLIQKLEFEHLPEVAADYITSTCCYEFVRDKIGDRVKMDELAKDKETARKALNSEDIKYSGTSLRTHPYVAGMLSNVMPNS
jgi:hypothetical protein